MQKIRFMVTYQSGSGIIRGKNIASELKRQGLDAEVFEGKESLENTICVINKPGSWEIIKDHIPQSALVVWDMCDWYYEYSQSIEMFKRSRYQIVAADQLAVYWCDQGIPRPIHIIEDPYTVKIKKPKISGNDRLQLFLYGHSANLLENELYNRIIDPINQSDLPSTHTIIMSDQEIDAVKYSNEKHQIAFEQWDSQAFEKIIADSDIVLLPMMKKDKWSKSKGHIRLLDSIMSGTYVIADNIPSYTKYSDFCYIKNNVDFVDGIKNYIQNKDNVLECLLKGQQFANDRYSLETIGGKWKVFLEEINEASTHY